VDYLDREEGGEAQRLLYWSGACASCRYTDAWSWSKNEGCLTRILLGSKAFSIPVVLERRTSLDLNSLLSQVFVSLGRYVSGFELRRLDTGLTVI